MLIHNLNITAQLKELQRKVAIGDEAAFAKMYQFYSRRLLHFAKAMVRSKELAEELVEDVFVKTWKNREQIDNIENLTVYFYVSVKNSALNAISKKSRELVTAPFDFLDIAVDELTEHPEELMITAEMLKKMQKAVDGLPPRCKMIFKLVREDGLKYREVADILNISVNTIDSQMAIAVKRICTALGVQKPRKAIQQVTQRK